MDQYIQLLEGLGQMDRCLGKCGCDGLGNCCPSCRGATTPDQRLNGLGDAGTVVDVVGGLALLAVTVYIVQVVVGAEMGTIPPRERRKPLMRRIKRSRTLAKVWA